MNKGPTPSRKVIGSRCPHCGMELNLRLPRGMGAGEYRVRCYSCSSRLDVSVSSDGKLEKLTRSGGKAIGAPPTPVRTSRSDLEAPRKIELGPGKLPYKKRLRAAFVLLIMVGVLGISSSLLTLSGSFRIKDLEEQSPNDTSDLNLWILDDTTGRGVMAAMVTVSSGSFNRTGYSDQNGLVVLRDVRIGQLALTIDKDGYRTVSGEIVVRKGTPNVLDIPMQKGDPSDTKALPTQQFKDKRYSPLLTDLAAVLMMMSALMAFIAAFFVHLRDLFFIALIGAFLSIFSLGFLIGSVLALFAFILIILSYEGFEHSHHLTRYIELYGKGRKTKDGHRTVIRS